MSRVTDDINRLVYAVREANDAATREAGEAGLGDVYVIPSSLWFRVQDALRPSLTPAAVASAAQSQERGPDA